MTTWTPGDVSGSPALTASDHLYAAHVNELRVAVDELAADNLVFLPQTYGAVGNGVANDVAAIQAAVDAANLAGGGDVDLGSSTYLVASAIEAKSNVRIIGRGNRAASITTVMNSSGERSIINVTGRTNVTIENVHLIPNQPSVGTGAGAITSYGHTTLRIRNVEISGTTNTSQTVIQLSGGSSGATGNFTDTVIEDCYFHDLPNTINVIRLYPRNGHKIYNTKILRNRFVGTAKRSIMLDCYDTLIDTVVDKNVFRDITGDVTDAGSAVWTRSPDYYYIDGLRITSNDYENTVTTVGQDQGFAFFYTCKNVVIDNNRIVGSWTVNQNTVGPALAPGRIYLPVIGLKVTNNFIKGFDAAWDPDSMRDAEITNNTVVRCGQNLCPGYGIQENVNIHHNYFYNSTHGTPVLAAEALGAATMFEKNLRITDNIYVDDRPIPVPSSVAAALDSGGSLTLAITYYYKVSAIDNTGETIASSEVSATPSGANRTIKVSCALIVGAEGYKIYRTTTAGVYGATSLLAIEHQPYFYDHGTTALTAGTPAGVSTVQAAATTTAVFVHGGLSGGINHSDALIKGNKFYMPRSSYTYILKKEYSDTVLPRRFEDNEFTDATGRLVEYVYAQGNVTGATTFDRANGAIISATMTGNTTVTLTAGLLTGETIQLRLTQDATGSRTATWPANFKKAGGTLTLTTTAGATDVITARCDGTNWIEVSRALNVS